MKITLKTLLVFAAIVGLCTIISLSFTTVKAGSIYSAPSTREFYYNGHHYITFLLNHAGANYGTVHDPDCPCHKH